MNHNPLSFLLILLCLYASALVPVHAANSSLSLKPDSGTFTVGEEFSVRIFVNTGDATVGSADATVVYDPSDLLLVSYSTDGSVFSSIIKDEDSSTAGRVRLQGIVSTNRGPYQGTDGLFATLVFQPLRNITTQVRIAEWSAAPLVASVGQAFSNILTESPNTVTYTLVPNEARAAAVGELVANPSAATFEITTLPTPEREWLGTTTVKLTWTVPEGATEMKTSISTDPNGTPSKVYQVPVSSVSVDGLVLGTNYFHLQFKQGDTWGSVTHYTLKVDTVPPEYIAVSEAPRDDPSDPRLVFLIEAGDAHSGIARYEIGKDGGPAEPWERPEDGKYRPEGLEPGEHTLTITAFDQAGNSTSTDTLFLVKSIESPTLVRAPDRVLTGDTITVEGTTFPNATVKVFISYNEGEATEKTVQSDDTGAFTATLTDAARAGKYTVWFSVTDERGAVSPPSIKRSVEVSQPYIMLFGSLAVTYLSVIVPLVAMILLLVLILWLGYAWMRGYRTRVRRETDEAYTTVRSEFEELRDDLVKQIGVLEQANQSRELTRQEMRIFHDLSRKLDAIERHIALEIDDIEAVEPASKGKGAVTHNTLGKFQPKGADLTPKPPEEHYEINTHTVRLSPRK